MNDTIIDAPGIAKLVELTSYGLKQDASLRILQAQNAPQAFNFDQRGFQGAASAVLPTAMQNPVTGNEVYRFQEAQAQGKLFTQAIITFDAGCGSGRYRIDGIDATTVQGIPIPSGGVVLVITGDNNIRNFSMMAEAGQSLTFARNLYV